MRIKRIKTEVTIDRTVDDLFKEAVELRKRYDDFETRLNIAFQEGKITTLEFNELACTAMYNYELKFE